MKLYSLKKTVSVRRLVFCLFILIFSMDLQAQNDTLESKTTLELEGYMDIFYSYDFNKPEPNSRLPYMVNHNRHNEFNLNLGLIGAHLNSERYRASLVFQAGSYVIDNYLEEDEKLRIIKEANAGLSLLKNNKLWFDAGIVVSHIGFESLRQRPDISLTRSFLAETIPYYLSGAKLTYTFNSKWLIMAMITNGWQRIYRVEGNSLMSFTAKVDFTPNEAFEIAVNSFVGTDDPDSTRRMRIFYDNYLLYRINDKWNLNAGFDFGFQQREKGSSEYYNWYVASALASYKIDPKLVVGGRVEFISDLNGVVINNPSPNPYSSWGLSANFDYKPNKFMIARVEGRYLISQDEVFVKGDSFKRDDLFITLSLSIDFNKVIQL